MEHENSERNESPFVEITPKHGKMLDDVVERIISQFEEESTRKKKGWSRGHNASKGTVTDVKALGCLYTQAVVAWLLEYKSYCYTNGIESNGTTQNTSMINWPSATKVRRVGRAIIHSYHVIVENEKRNALAASATPNTSTIIDHDFYKNRVKAALHDEYLLESHEPVWGGRDKDEFYKFFYCV